MTKISRLASRIVEIRKSLKWTQDDLAEKSGLSKGAVARIERGARIPRPSTLQVIAKALGVSSEVLQYGEGIPKIVESVDSRKLDLISMIIDTNLTLDQMDLIAAIPKLRHGTVETLIQVIASLSEDAEGSTVGPPDNLKLRK